MAKRRKVGDAEIEGVFKEPEFNEREFLKNEIKKAKGIIIIFIIAVGVGILSAYVQISMGTIFAILIGVIVLILIKQILSSLNAEFSDRNGWVFAILAFIILWLSFWSVGLNPPFNDVSPPQIRSIDVLLYGNNTWIRVYDYEQQFNKNLNDEIENNIKKINSNNITEVRAVVTDNSQVGTVYINNEQATLENGYYLVKLTGVSEITVTATDLAGHKATQRVTFPTGSGK